MNETYSESVAFCRTIGDVCHESGTLSDDVFLVNVSVSNDVSRESEILSSGVCHENETSICDHDDEPYPETETVYAPWNGTCASWKQ